MLEIKLSLQFNQKIVFDEAQFSLMPGEKVEIISDPQTGKTTFFEAICGIIKVRRGSSINCNFSPIAFLPSEAVFFENKTVIQNLMYAMKVLKIKDVEVLNQALNNSGLEAKANEKVKNLAYFERQNLALARAMIKKPELILIDDWFKNADESSQKLRTKLDWLLSIADLSLIIAVRNPIGIENKVNSIYTISDKKILKIDNKK